MPNNFVSRLSTFWKCFYNYLHFPHFQIIMYMHVGKLPRCPTEKKPVRFSIPQMIFRNFFLISVGYRPEELVFCRGCVGECYLRVISDEQLIFSSLSLSLIDSSFRMYYWGRYHPFNTLLLVSYSLACSSIVSQTHRRSGLDVLLEIIIKWRSTPEFNRVVNQGLCGEDTGLRCHHTICLAP